MKAILETARHELVVALRTRRAVLALAVYLALASFGQLVYVLSLRSLEAQARALLERGEAAENAMLLDLFRQDTYQKLVAWFAGIEASAMAPYLRDSVLLPVLLWGSLAFLPFVVVLTSFDQLSADLESRSLCYTILRAPRRAILLGKLLAHAVLMTALLLITGSLLIVTGTALLDSVDLGATLVGFTGVVLLLVPYGLCYLGISSFASANAAQPFTALVSAFGITILLRLVAWLEYIPETHRLALLRPLAQLSPANHHTGLWLAGFSGPATSALVYLGLGGAFTLLALWRLEGRDL